LVGTPPDQVEKQGGRTLACVVVGRPAPEVAYGFAAGRRSLQQGPEVGPGLGLVVGHLLRQLSAMVLVLWGEVDVAVVADLETGQGDSPDAVQHIAVVGVDESDRHCVFAL